MENGSGVNLSRLPLPPAGGSAEKLTLRRTLRCPHPGLGSIPARLDRTGRAWPVPLPAVEGPATPPGGALGASDLPTPPGRDAEPAHRLRDGGPGATDLVGDLLVR